MKTKKVFATLIAIMMVATVVAQQGQKKGNRTPEERAQRQTEWMKQDLQLTQEQTTKVEAINLKYAIESNNMQQEFKTKRATHRAQKDAELDKVLSPEQVTKLKEIRDNRNNMRRERKQHMRNCMKGCNNQAK